MTDPALSPEASRLIVSLVIGEVADRLFAQECRRQKIPEQVALAAPLLFLANPPSKERH